MLLFCDTEFTGLGQPNPKLISLALVPADGGIPFYIELAESDGWELSDCNSFVVREDPFSRVATTSCHEQNYATGS